MEAQTKFIQAAVEKKSAPGQPRSVFTVKTESKLPILEESNRKIREYYVEFKSHCQLANDGLGMSKQEMLILQAQSLRGSHKQVYDNEVKTARAKGEYETDGLRVHLWRWVALPFAKMCFFSNAAWAQGLLHEGPGWPS